MSSTPAVAKILASRDHRKLKEYAVDLIDELGKSQKEARDASDTLRKIKLILYDGRKDKLKAIADLVRDDGEDEGEEAESVKNEDKDEEEHEAIANATVHVSVHKESKGPNIAAKRPREENTTEGNSKVTTAKRPRQTDKNFMKPSKKKKWVYTPEQLAAFAKTMPAWRESCTKELVFISHNRRTCRWVHLDQAEYFPSNDLAKLPKGPPQHNKV